MATTVPVTVRPDFDLMLTDFAGGVVHHLNDDSAGFDLAPIWIDDQRVLFSSVIAEDALNLEIVVVNTSTR